MTIHEHQPRDTPDVSEQQVREVDATLSIMRVNIITVVALPLLAGAILLPHTLLWRFPAFPESSEILAIVVMFVIGLALKEFLHKVGWWRWGGVPWREIDFGFDRRTYSFYARTEIEMPASGYRRGVALPLLVLGVLPAVAGIALNIPFLTWYALIMLVASGGNLATLWSMRRMDDDLLVRDHPERAGCMILVYEE